MNKITVTGTGVNYIEMWMDKNRLDEIGEQNINTEYFEDNLIDDENVICDFSGIIVDDGFIVQVIDNETNEASDYDGEEIRIDEEDFISDNEASYDDFEDNKVLIRYARIERGPYLEFEINEDFNLSKLEFFSYDLEPFNEASIIIAGNYDGKKIELNFGDTVGIKEEVKVIHNSDEYSDRDESDYWEY